MDRIIDQINQDFSSPWIVSKCPEVYCIDDDITYRSSREGILIYQYRPNNSSREIIVPSQINGLNVLGISKMAFVGYAADLGEPLYSDFPIDMLIISEGIEFIDANAFKNTEGIKNIQLPNTLKYIGRRCFELAQIHSINLPASIVDIGSNAFSTMIFLYDIEIESRISKIRRETFFCNEITSVILPDGLSTIEMFAFRGSKISNIILPDATRRIEKGAFSDCPHLVSVVLPRKISNIADDAFDSNETNPRLTFYVYPGSYGLIWAREHGYPIKSAEV